jgi:hypothetical protein
MELLYPNMEKKKKIQHHELSSRSVPVTRINIYYVFVENPWHLLPTAYSDRTASEFSFQVSFLFTYFGNSFITVLIQVLTAASMKMTVFWDLAPCSLVEDYRRFRSACCFHHQGDRPDGATSQKTVILMLFISSSPMILSHL